MKKGLNTMNWDMRYPGASTFPGMILWWATTNGPKVVPGEYKVELSVNGESQETNFQLLKDPRSSASQSELEEQFAFINSVKKKLSETNEAISKIRKARKQINEVMAKVEDENVKATGKKILEEMKEIEEALYQTKNESRQDPLNFPIKLNNKLGHLASLEGIGDFKPTEQAKAFMTEVTAEIDSYLKKLEDLFGSRIDEFNSQVAATSFKAVQLED